MSHSILLLKVLTLLTVANGAPVVASKVSWFDIPVDGGVRFYDGRPLFGRSKTVRGIVVSLVATSLIAELLGWHWILGSAVAAAAMAGDLGTSFVKRRLGLAPHYRAMGLDQIPESALPILVVQGPLGLEIADVAVVVGVFAVVAVVGSRALFQLGLKNRPY